MWEYYNPNPIGMNGVGDCAVRAIAKALDISWEQAYTKLCVNGFLMGNLPNADIVWGAVLREAGFNRSVIPNTCPECFTVEDFCKEHPKGVFVVKSQDHVATVMDGILYDSWDSSRNVPIYFWFRPDEKG